MARSDIHNAVYVSDFLLFSGLSNEPRKKKITGNKKRHNYWLSSSAGFPCPPGIPKWVAPRYGSLDDRNQCENQSRFRRRIQFTRIINEKAFSQKIIALIRRHQKLTIRSDQAYCDHGNRIFF
jgi:hypothetical protein